MGEHGRGIPLANRALDIRRRLLGAEHPLVLSTLNEIGLLYLNLGNWKQAESFYRQALDVRRKILGNDHPDTAVCVNNLAYVAEAKGELVAAEGLHAEALAIRRKTLGERSILTGQSFDALAGLRARLAAQASRQADFAEARRVQGDLVQQLAVRYGEQNWRVVDARLSLVEIDFIERLSPEDRGQLKAAREQEQERNRLVGERHFREALGPGERALAIRRKIQGDAEHRGCRATPQLTWAMPTQGVKEPRQGRAAAAGDAGHSPETVRGRTSSNGSGAAVHGESL